MDPAPQPQLARWSEPFPPSRSLLDQGVLVLNRHWTAIHVCTVRRALALLFQDLAHVVTEDYQALDFDSWRDVSASRPRDGSFIHTPQYAICAPDVIVLARYNRMPPRKVKFNRRNIFLRDNFTCQYCGAKPRRDELTIDHIVPRSRGGGSTWDNVALACVKCNAKKGNLSLKEAGLSLVRPPKRPHWLACVSYVPGPRGRSIWERFVDKAYWMADLHE